MKNYNLSFLFVVSIFASATSSFADTNLDIISQNIENVCKKPADAGKYWDMKVSADGEARLRLILPKVGASGTATFTKGEWEGIQSTVEDNINYRDCVKIIAPIFIEKFDNLIDQPLKNEKEEKVLGGVSWEESAFGVSLTLQSCVKKSKNITCHLLAKSLQNDTNFTISYETAIYDQNGNKFDASYVSIANKNTSVNSVHQMLGGDLIKNIETPIQISFLNDIDSSKIISKAFIATRIKNSDVNEKHNFDFRNIKLLIEK